MLEKYIPNIPINQDFWEIVILLAITSLLVMWLVRIIYRRILRKKQKAYDALVEQKLSVERAKENLSKKLGETSAENAQLHQQITNLRNQNDNYVNKLDDALAYKVRYDNIKINYERSQSQVAALETQLRELETAYQQLQHTQVENSHTAQLPPPPLPFLADDLPTAENTEEDTIADENTNLPVLASEKDEGDTTDIIDEKVVEPIEENAVPPKKDSLFKRFNRWFRAN